MEYVNKTDQAYYKALKRPMRIIKIKMEILDHWERAIGEITNNIGADDIGTININYQQGCRRSCSFSIIDRKKKFIPTKDSWFWYNRKFKIYLGVKVGDDIYWFPQGVFITLSATAKGRVISIEGIDKFGFLNGELNTRMCMVEYQAPVLYSQKGTKIVDLIKDTLMLDMGNNMPLDPVEPIIDGLFKNAVLYDDIVVAEGQYLGEIFTKLCDMYGANCYYDTNGHLRFERVFNWNVPSYYRHMAPLYEFENLNLTYSEASLAFDFKGYNIVTVSTDNTIGEVYSYTAINDNPQSPVCVSSVGYKGNSTGTVEISLGDTEEWAFDTGDEKCRQYAEYLLLQNTLMGMTISFEYPILPHLDVNHTIEITCPKYNLDKQLFIVQSLTIPIGLGTMNVEATNIQWLPTDTDCASIYNESR